MTASRGEMLGCRMDNLTMEETLERIEGFIREGGPHQHVVVNADKIVKAHRDPEICKIVNNCHIVNADGMPLVWVSRILGRPLKGRVTGIDLFGKLLERAAQKGWRVFFFGAREQVVRKVVDWSFDKYPSLQIAGYRNGYWQPEEEPTVVESIKNAGADILLVAISSPKKEQFLGRYLGEMQIPFAMGVGGTFDVVAGLTSRAPAWMQRVGLEWFYRFLQEPRRMFRRYFVEDMFFFWLLLKAMLKKQSQPSQTKPVPNNTK